MKEKIKNFLEINAYKQIQIAMDGSDESILGLLLAADALSEIAPIEILLLTSQEFQNKNYEIICNICDHFKIKRTYLPIKFLQSNIKNTLRDLCKKEDDPGYDMVVLDAIRSSINGVMAQKRNSATLISINKTRLEVDDLNQFYFQWIHFNLLGSYSYSQLNNLYLILREKYSNLKQLNSLSFAMSEPLPEGIDKRTGLATWGELENVLEKLSNLDQNREDLSQILSSNDPDKKVYGLIRRSEYIKRLRCPNLEIDL